jgi:dTDP-4-amino-4,6-dideoxygalactose transaminase
MAAWQGAAEVCGVSCATMGLYGTLRAFDIGPGDEVITTVHTAIATAEAVSLTGAQVVFCDIEDGSYNIDPAEIEKKITPKTKALIPVHLYGQPADLDRIAALATEHSLFLIEDCAQAQGARYHGKRVGTFGDAAVFSFFPSKNLGGFGDGGAVTAKDADRMKRIRMFSNHGREKKYWHEFEGINSRLDSLQAALLRQCLPHVDDWNRQRREAAAWYDALLEPVPHVTTPQVLANTDPIYHVYVILVPDRDALEEHLKAEGIGTGVHYPYALNQLPAYAHLNQGAGTFPNAEHACAHMLSLPMFPGIRKDEVDVVCATIKDFLESHSA